jgi:hypothetical protein
VCDQWAGLSRQQQSSHPVENSKPGSGRHQHSGPTGSSPRSNRNDSRTCLNKLFHSRERRLTWPCPVGCWLAHRPGAGHPWQRRERQALWVAHMGSEDAGDTPVAVIAHLEALSTVQSPAASVRAFGAGPDQTGSVRLCCEYQRHHELAVPARSINGHTWQGSTRSAHLAVSL